MPFAKGAKATPASLWDGFQCVPLDRRFGGWRAAVILVPSGQELALAEELAVQLGRGGREMQLNLSRAFVALGEAVAIPVLRKAMSSKDQDVVAHAKATERFFNEPDAGSEFAVNQVKRIFAPGR